MLRKSVVVVLVVFIACSLAAAQKIELAALGGGQFPRGSTTTTFEKSGATQFNFAVRLAGVPLVAAYAEVPVVFGLKSITSSLTPTIPHDYTSLFVTPGLKLKIAPSFPVSPFLAGGVGYARLNASSTLVNGDPNPARVTNKAVFEFGGGLDWKIAPFLSFRAEVRDFYSGLPAQDLSARQHTVMPLGGLVLRF